MIQITLPWPPSVLMPNSSKRHWRSKQPAAQLYKSVCAIELREQDVGMVDADRVHLTITFCPPDLRRRDIDNALASIKYALDAVSEAIGVDDYFFGLTLLRGKPVAKGRIDIQITEE